MSFSHQHSLYPIITNYRYTSITFNFILLVLFCSFGLTSYAQDRIVLEEYARGLSNPVDITHAGDDRLFIVEKGGFIRILEANGSLVATPFLDIDSLVRSNESERGLLGLAFHPNYASNGYFFVNYTNNDGDTQISRFSVSSDDPNIADAASQKRLLKVEQPYENHNGGDLAFGPDGYLYIGLGDGGLGGDPVNAGQTRTTLLGKMLRIDIDNGDPYAIPTSNPFADTDFTLDEVWALGLRNPWRFSFDRLTGDLWIGDVGQGLWEEVDMQLANSPGGENYGWRCYEGNAAFNTNGCPDGGDFVFPIYDYTSNFTEGCSVTGGYVYRGTAFPDLYGHYVYTDFCSGRIWTLYPDGADGWTNTEWLNGANSEYSSFGEDQAGELYLAAYSGGQIFRVIDQCSELAVQSSVDFISCTGADDGKIALEISNPSNEFTVAWSNGANTATIENLAPGEYSYTVTNDWGCTRSESLFVMEPFPESVTVMVDGNQLSVSDNWETYQWLVNGDTIVDAIGPSYTAVASGDYTVVVSDGSGCKFVSQVVSVAVNSNADILAISGLSISPNPTKDFFVVNLSLSGGQEMKVRLLDKLGRVHFVHLLRSSGAQSFEVPVAQLPAGIYFVSFRLGNQQLTRKVVKE